MAAPSARRVGGKKRKSAAAGLGDLHDDMLERVLARLPPASYFRLRGVSRRWRAAAGSATFRAACARVPARDPWFLMLPGSDGGDERPQVVFDSAERAWARWRGAPGPLPVAASGGLVLYRDPASGELTVVNPLTGATRALPPCAAAGAGALRAVAMYGSHPYRVVLVLGDLPDLAAATFDPSTGAWDGPVPLAPDPGSPHRAAADDSDAVYFLSKAGDVVSTAMHRTASRQHACAVVACRDGANAVAYFLGPTGAVVACDLSRRAFAELPRILPAHHEYSVDVVACGGGAAYAVVLSEFLGAASLRVWEFVAGEGWRQAAAMPPAMAHPFLGAKADVNCVGHGGRVLVCVSGSGGASGCFVCDVATNRWEELPRCVGEAAEFVAAVSFEPRMEAHV